MVRTGSRQRGGVLNIVIIVIILGVAAFFYFRQAGNSPGDLARKQQLDAESGLRYYATTAYQFVKQENGVQFDAVERTVSRDDWQWFMSNYQNFKSDTFNVGGAIDPTVSTALDKRTALMHLLTSGPMGGGIEITDRKVGDVQATLTVKFQNYSEAHETREVTMVKEDGVWKMKDFAGERTIVENPDARDKIVKDVVPLGADPPASATSQPAAVVAPARPAAGPATPAPKGPVPELTPL